MEVPLLLQFLIALFVGMVASTFVPPVRRAIPRPVEVMMWIGLITVCVIGMVSITDKSARELTASAAWGIEQVINTMVGMLGAGVMAWLGDHRFMIATGVLVLAGACLIALAAIRSARSAQRRRPRVRLREWMEVPLPMAPRPARAGVAGALGRVNRRVAAAAAVGGASLLTAGLNFAIWGRNVLVPTGARRLAHAAAIGRVESKARLEALRDSAAHVQFAARAWYTAAGAPAVSGLATRTADALRTAGELQRGVEPPEVAGGHVLNVQAFLSGQSLGWYGPLRPALHIPGEDEEENGSESQPDSLAS
ncbi:MAG TPA: hypothetical protein VGG31_08525 [Candidatus Dormibacteraeota bacterium]